jgi:ribosomal protein S27AE
MQTPLANHPSALECPRCGKHTIVNHHDGVYQCLNCGFKRDFSDPSSAQEEGLGAMIFAAAGFLVTLALFL